MGKVWIVVGVLGLVITLIRQYFASNDSKKKAQEKDSNKKAYEDSLAVLLRTCNGNADYSLISGCAALAVDQTAGTLFVSGSSTENQWKSILFTELEDVLLEDHSEEYKHALEMEGYYSKVHRTSMFNPNGGHSWEEVKKGHESFSAFNGKPVFSIIVKCLNAETIPLPLYYGDGTLFWIAEKELEQAKEFVQKTNALIK